MGRAGIINFRAFSEDDFSKDAEKILVMKADKLKYKSGHF